MVAIRLVNYVLARKSQFGWRIAQGTGSPMVDGSMRQMMQGTDCDTAVAEFIRTRGVTRCPTACVLPTQGSVAVADREALEEYAARRNQLRRAKLAARLQQFWPAELVQSVGK